MVQIQKKHRKFRKWNKNAIKAPCDVRRDWERQENTTIGKLKAYSINFRNSDFVFYSDN